MGKIFSKPQTRNMHSSIPQQDEVNGSISRGGQAREHEGDAVCVLSRSFAGGRSPADVREGVHWERVSAVAGPRACMRPLQCRGRRTPPGGRFSRP